MFRWSRTLSSQLILICIIIFISGCSSTRLNWMYKKAEVDLKTVSNATQYQQDYIECNAYSRAYRNGYAVIATSTGTSAVTSGVGSYIFPSAALDTATSVGTGVAGGALGGFLWSSWVTNHKINRDTAMCLIGRGYTLLDQKWWEDMHKYIKHGN